MNPELDCEVMGARGIPWSTAFVPEEEEGVGWEAGDCGVGFVNMSPDECQDTVIPRDACQKRVRSVSSDEMVVS